MREARVSQVGENTTRPNGKKWKKKWGKEGPPAHIKLEAQVQSNKSKKGNTRVR